MFEKSEKDKLEYNEKMKNKEKQNINNTPINLNHQINNLHQEISQLENQNNPQSQNLLNSKKEDLAKLENKLKEKQLPTEQKNNNSKLIWGIGLGILGLGLIGLVVYLIAKKEKSR